MKTEIEQAGISTPYAISGDEQQAINGDTLEEKIVSLVNASKVKVAVAVNATLTELYWNIGNLINTAFLENKRADYGAHIVENISKTLTQKFGNGWSVKQIHRFMQFAKEFDREKLATVWRQLTWSHIKQILPMDDPLKRDFYIEMCKMENWSVRTLSERIDSMLYERTAISKKGELTIKNELAKLENAEKLSPDLVFRDPYLLDFLDLHDSYSEKDLENAIIAEMENFILEMGTDFAFMARQKRITVDNEDYYIDLLFFHRHLKCLVAIELKLGAFKAQYKGQMELYLSYLEKNMMADGEEKPIGLILCAGKNEEHVELMQLDKSNIRVADYMTILPPKELLQEKLLLSIERAKNRQKGTNLKTEN
ncbi:MAG: DUF1016 family protein [Treponema sp.]|nr:DUF1016 family protein [Treponema sp.]